MKEWILNRMTELHIKLYDRRSYENTEQSNFERLKDTIRYEQLKEVCRNNPEWDQEKMSVELSKRIRKKQTINY